VTYGPAKGRGGSGQPARSAQAGRSDQAGRPAQAGRPDHPRRPALLGKVALDSIGGSPDPAQLAEAAHTTASLLVESGRA